MTLVCKREKKKSKQKAFRTFLGSELLVRAPAVCFPAACVVLGCDRLSVMGTDPVL